MTAGRRRRTCWMGVLLVSLAAAACDRDAAIRVAYAGSADFDMLPSVEAHATLATEGLGVDLVHYARSELAVEAVARGEAEIGHGSVRNYWAAASRGAPVRLVMAHTGNVHRLVAHAAILHCSALDGRGVAVQSEGAAGTVFLRALLADRCPDALPAYLYLQMSTNRAAALLSGRVRATVLKLADVVRLDRLAPGRFRVLGNFGELWGDIVTSGVFVNADWATEHPDLVRRYLRARILSHRMPVDARELASRAANALGESDDWGAVGGAYVSANVWDADGGVTDETIERSLAFFVEHGNLPASLGGSTAADLSFLTDVLADLDDEARRIP